jgi:hypothetical protein
LKQALESSTRTKSQNSPENYTVKRGTKTPHEIRVPEESGKIYLVLEREQSKGGSFLFRHRAFAEFFDRNIQFEHLCGYFDLTPRAVCGRYIW